MIEGKAYPPFGISVKRFLALGYHPRFESRPGTFKNPKMCPGYYKWDRPQKIPCKVPSWKRQTELEEYSRRLGYRNECKLKESKWMESVNGPGWQDIPETISKRGVAFSKAVRFPVPKFKAFSVPGPGIYGKYHVPEASLEEKSISKGFSFSNVPPFDQRSHAPRSLTTQHTVTPPPNHYHIKTSINELISKRVSKRGPYELFTVNRFPDRVVYNTQLFVPKLSHSSLNHPSNAFKGKFLACGKDSIVTSRLALTNLSLAKKSPFDPGPNHYDPYPTPVITQAKAPFNFSAVEARPGVKCELSPPPPGRYNPSSKRKILGNGMKSAFLSKVKRTLPQPEKLSWFE